jgi:hypothetical protein
LPVPSMLPLFAIGIGRMGEKTSGRWAWLHFGFVHAAVGRDRRPPQREAGR